MSLIFPCYILHSCRSIRWRWLVALSVVSAVLVGGTSPCSSKPADAAENGAELETQFRADVAPFLKTNCLDCHGSEDPAAKLDLSGYTSSEKVAKDHQTWAIVLDRLRAGEMPPKHAEPQPTRQQRDGRHGVQGRSQPPKKSRGLAHQWVADDQVLEWRLKLARKIPSIPLLRRVRVP